MSVDYFAKCIGIPLDRIGHAADLVWIILGEVSVHFSSNVVILLDGQVIVQTNDLYFDAEKKPVVYVPRHTLFDEKIDSLLKKEIQYRVISIAYDSAMDLNIIFSNGLQIRTCGIENFEEEKWRVLIKGSDFPHMVAYRSGIEWE